MKMKYLLRVLLLVYVFLIVGCTKEPYTIAEKDCGSDMGCYVSSLKACSPARHYISEGNQFAEMKVLGLEGTVCKTEWKSNDGEMICKIPQSDIDKVTKNDLTAGYGVIKICKGSLVDKLTQQIKILNQ